MEEDDPTVIIIIILMIFIMIGGGLGFAYKKGYIGGDDDAVDVVSNDACSEYTCPTGYSADPTATDTLCSSSTCTIADKDTCCNSDTLPTCADFTCTLPGNILNTIPGNITCSADPCTETECCSDNDASGNTGCTPDPCLNGGTCNATASGYTCACVTGYSGDNCADTTPTDTDCVGRWSDCSAPSCSRQTYTITEPSTGSGQPCATADQADRPCAEISCGSGNNCILSQDIAYRFDSTINLNLGAFTNGEQTVGCADGYKNSATYRSTLVSNSDYVNLDFDKQAVLGCSGVGIDVVVDQGACSTCDSGYSPDTDNPGNCIINECQCLAGTGTRGTACIPGSPATFCAACDSGQAPVSGSCSTGACNTFNPVYKNNTELTHVALESTDWFTGGCLDDPPPDICKPGWTHGSGSQDLCGIPTTITTSTDAESTCGITADTYLRCVGNDGNKGDYNGCECNCSVGYSATTTTGQSDVFCEPNKCLNSGGTPTALFITKVQDESEAGFDAANSSCVGVDPGNIDLSGTCNYSCLDGYYKNFNDNYTCQDGKIANGSGTEVAYNNGDNLCGSCTDPDNFDNGGATSIQSATCSLTGGNIQFTAIDCGVGYQQKGVTSISKDQVGLPATGNDLKPGCASIQCGTGMHLEGGNCVVNQWKCDNGTAKLPGPSWDSSSSSCSDVSYADQTACEATRVVCDGSNGGTCNTPAKHDTFYYCQIPNQAGDAIDDGWSCDWSDSCDGNCCKGVSVNVQNYTNDQLGSTDITEADVYKETQHDGSLSVDGCTEGWHPVKVGPLQPLCIDGGGDVIDLEAVLKLDVSKFSKYSLLWQIHEHDLPYAQTYEHTTTDLRTTGDGSGLDILCQHAGGELKKSSDMDNIATPHPQRVCLKNRSQCPGGINDSKFPTLTSHRIKHHNKITCGRCFGHTTEAATPQRSLSTAGPNLRSTLNAIRIKTDPATGTPSVNVEENPAGSRSALNRIMCGQCPTGSAPAAANGMESLIRSQAPRYLFDLSSSPPITAWGEGTANPADQTSDQTAYDNLNFSDLYCLNP